MFLKECGPSGDEKLIEKLSEKKEEIGVAVKIMNKLSADEIEYQKYLAREKFLMDEISKKKYAEYKMNKIKEERDDAVARKEKAEQENKKAQEEKKKAQEEKQKAQEEKQKRKNRRKKLNRWLEKC
jgi:exopolyphosphatase/pppGpp-phosphohydrolase